MTTVLICARGYGVAELLDGVAWTVAADAALVVLHVVDDRPASEIEHVFAHLPGRGPGRQRASERIRRADGDARAAIEAEVTGWSARHGRVVALIPSTGRPEREIVRVAGERAADVVALGGGGAIGPRRHGPVVQYVIDHAPCAVLIVPPPDGL